MAGDGVFHSGCKESQSLQVGPETRLAARLAIYADGEPAVSIEDIEGTGPQELIHRLSTRIAQVIRAGGSSLPQAALKALLENLVHAGFRGVTVSILDEGHLVRIADHCPGIVDKRLARTPGYSGAGEAERQVIAGVGAGLPTAKALVEGAGGRLELDDNLGCGAVISLSVPHPSRGSARPGVPVRVGVAPEPADQATVLSRSAVTDAGKRILLLVAEVGGAGLPTICDELRVAKSAAELELEQLRRLGLVDPNGGEQMTLTPGGLAYLDGIFSE